MPGFLVCPRCKLSLTQKGVVLHCENCGLKCVLDEGIYDFIGSEGSYWGEVSSEEMEKALEDAKVNGWKVAARDVGLKYHDINEYILSNGRIDWLFHCLDFTRTKSCLDLGSGWGTVTFGLAQYYDEVWSLEAVKQRIEFQKIRQEQDGVNNIKFVRADWLWLPFPDNCFDLVAANGVLEWVGLSDYFRNPRQVQLDFLKEIRRVLKPGGCLYVGIENRFGLPFLLGGKDHSGLPFTSILPRRLANLAVRLFRKTEGEYRRDKRMEEEWKSYRTYTYSFSGYRKLLKEAYFDQVDLYWTFSYNIPKYAGRFDGESFSFFFKFLRKNITTFRSLGSFLISIGSRFPERLIAFVLPLICPSFLIFAYKEDKGASFESSLLESGEPVSSFLRVSGSHGINSKINYFLLKDGKARYVLKFPRYRVGTSSLEKEEEEMGRFNQLEIKKRSVALTTVFAEPAIKGILCQPYSFLHNRKVLKWLLDFQQKTQKGTWDFEQLAARVTMLGDFLMKTHIDINSEVRLRSRESLELFMTSLGTVQLSKNAEHGDFFTGNILIGDDGQVYVTDWEFYQEESEPLFDFTFFILTNCIEAGKSPDSLQSNLLGRGKYSLILKALMSEFVQSKGLLTKLVMQAIPYTIVRCLHRATTGEEDNRHLNIALYIRLLELCSGFFRAPFDFV